MLSTDQKGAIAELAIAALAVELGVGVYRPVAEGGRYDLVFDVDGRLLRVQCKWASLHGSVIVVRCRRCRRTKEGLLHRGYEADEIDGIAAYCFALRRCFYIRIEQIAGRMTLQLRVHPTRNNQSQFVNWAADSGLERLQSSGTGP